MYKTKLFVDGEKASTREFKDMFDLFSYIMGMINKFSKCREIYSEYLISIDLAEILEFAGYGKLDINEDICFIIEEV